MSSHKNQKTSFFKIQAVSNKRRNKNLKDNFPEGSVPEMASQNMELLSIPLSEFVPDPNQARHDFTNIDELKESIKQFGLLEPITVTKRDDGKYNIINGERRYRAIKLWASEANKDISQETIDAVCINEEIDRFAGLIINMMREDYSPFEIAVTLQNMKYSNENLTDKEIGKYIGRSRNLVTEYFSLLKLPREIKEKELAKSIVPFNKLKRLAVGANESNAKEKIIEYEKLVAKYSIDQSQESAIKSDEAQDTQITQESSPHFTKKFVTMSNRITATIRSIEKFKIEKDSSPEEKEAAIAKLDEIISKAQKKKTDLTNNT